MVQQQVNQTIRRKIYMLNQPCVSAGEARRVQVPDRKEAPVPAGQLLLPPQLFLPQIPGTDGVRPADHRAGGGPVMQEKNYSD